MESSVDDTKSFLSLKRKLSNESGYQQEAVDEQKQMSGRPPSDFEPNSVPVGMGSPPKKRVFLTVDAEGNQVQVEVPHNALPEGVNPDDGSSYIVNEDINLDLSSYSYSVVVDGIVEDVELNECQYSSEDPVKMVKQSDLVDSESDDHEVDENKGYMLAEPDDADPMFKTHYRMSRIVASVSFHESSYMRAIP